MAQQIIEEFEANLAEIFHKLFLSKGITIMKREEILAVIKGTKWEPDVQDPKWLRNPQYPKYKVDCANGLTYFDDEYVCGYLTSIKTGKFSELTPELRKIVLEAGLKISN